MLILVKHTITNRLRLMEPGKQWSHASGLAVTLLLLLIVISPVTQTVWSGDNFFDHAHDTESTLVVCLTIVSLALGLCRDRQGTLAELLAVISRFFTLFEMSTGKLQAASTCPEHWLDSAGCIRPSDAMAYHLPLRI